MRQLALLLFLCIAFQLSLPGAAQVGDKELLFPVKSKGKWGYIDAHAKLVVPTIYDSATDYERGLALVSLAGKSRVIDSQGKLVFDTGRSGWFRLLGGLLYFRKGQDEQVIDLPGKVLIPPGQYSSQGVSTDGLIPVMNKGSDGVRKFGFVDRAGAVRIPLQFEWAGDFNRGLAPARLDQQKYGYIDHSGKFVIPPQFDRADPFYQDLALVSIGGKDGLIDRKGKIVIKPQFDQIDPRSFCNELPMFASGALSIKNDGQWGFLDRSGQVSHLGKYKFTGSFSDGVAVVKTDDQNYGAIDKKGKLLFKLPCTVMLASHGGFCCWQDTKTGRWRFVDHAGKSLEAISRESSSFQGGLARIDAPDGSVGYINSSGKFVWPLQQ